MDIPFDGRNPAPPGIYENPVNNRKNYVLQSQLVNARFLNHQQDHTNSKLFLSSDDRRMTSVQLSWGSCPGVGSRKYR